MKYKKRWMLLLLIVLFISFVWEIMHLPLYSYEIKINLTLHLFLASLTDTILIGLVLIGISLKNSWTSEWILNPSKGDYISIVVIGIFMSIIIEGRALAVKTWKYSELMPTLWTLGIIPLIQLFTTLIIAMFIMGLLLGEIKLWKIN